jgi:hypothetical protein
VPSIRHEREAARDNANHGLDDHKRGRDRKRHDEPSKRRPPQLAQAVGMIVVMIMMAADLS